MDRGPASSSLGQAQRRHRINAGPGNAGRFGQGYESLRRLVLVACPALAISQALSAVS